MDASRTTPQRHDLIIIGGGPAGMSAALVAGRCLLDTAIINLETPRNAVTTASHGFLTRDGAHPRELLAIAKAQLTRYSSVSYIKDAVVALERRAGTFEARLASGDALAAPRVIVATGYRDDLEKLGIPGIDSVYGRSVYPCPFCDGFEHHGEALAIFGASGLDHFVPVVRNWSTDLIVFSHGDAVEPEVVAALESRGVRTVEARIERLVARDGVLEAIELATGERIERSAGFLARDCSVTNAPFIANLGVTMTSNPWGMEVPEVDDIGRCNIEGLFFVGDSRSGFGGLINAASQGSTCVQTMVVERALASW